MMSPDVDEPAQEELDVRSEAPALRGPSQGQREDHRGEGQSTRNRQHEGLGSMEK